jgi:nicotinamide-nucleotide amidase
VTYTAKAKTELRGISADLIKSHGTVGEKITCEMARCIREKLNAAWGLAVTGNAGPTADKNALKNAEADQIGRCYTATAGARGVICQAHNIHGDRADIQLRASNLAIDMLRREILCMRD